MGGLGFGFVVNRVGRWCQSELLFQFSPVAFLEAIKTGCGGCRAGIDVAVQCFVALAHLLPFANGEAVTVTPGHQLLGAELLDELGVDFGQMHEAGWIDRVHTIVCHIG